MATLSMPTPPANSFGFLYRVSLEGFFYRMQMRWNGRDASWYLDLGDNAGNATVRNLRLVIGTDLFEPYKGLGQELVPQGVLSVVDTNNSGIEAGREELGARVLLLYTEADA